MNTAPSHDTIRVLCLYDQSQPPPDVTALLAGDDCLNFLGNFDVTPGPIAQLRDLDPNVAIVQLPMSALQLLRWVSFLRRHLQDCTILVTCRAPKEQDPQASFEAAETLVSGIIELDVRKHNDAYVRTILVKKMRGTRLTPAEYGFSLEAQGGVCLIARL